MVRILFFVLSDISAGELTIAYEFARRLDATKYRVHFVVPTQYSSYLQDRGIAHLTLQTSAGPLQNRTRIAELINEFRPDIFVVSDAFTLEFAFSWSGLRMAHLQAYRVPILGVDEYDYLRAGFALDYYGGLLNRLAPLIERYDYIIRNCPLSAPGSNTPKAWCYSLYPDKLEIAPSTRAEIRRRLGVAEGEKVVFYTTSSWETLNMYSVSALDAFIRWIPRMLQNYLAALDRPLTVIHVGPNPWGALPEGPVRYHHFARLAPTDFDQYLLSADLFITLNVVSVTLSKAIFGAVPSLVLQNQKLIEFEGLARRLRQMPEWYQAMASDVKVAHPFRAGTLGLHHFLGTVLTDNPYIDAYIEAQLFKHGEVLEKLHQCLYDDAATAALRARQMGYVAQVLKLPTPNEIMDEVLTNVAG